MHLANLAKLLHTIHLCPTYAISGSWSVFTMCKQLTYTNTNTNTFVHRCTVHTHTNTCNLVFPLDARICSARINLQFELSRIYFIFFFVPLLFSYDYYCYYRHYFSFLAVFILGNDFLFLRTVLAVAASVHTPSQNAKSSSAEVLVNVATK